MSTEYNHQLYQNTEKNSWNNIELGKAPKNTQPTLYEELKAKTERFLSRNSQYNVGAVPVDRDYRREERTISERDDDKLGYHLVGLLIAMLSIVIVCLKSIKRK